MKPHVLIAAAFGLLALSPDAMALTLTNVDDAAYSIMVTMKDGASKTIDLAAKGTAEVDCAAGCELTLNGEKMMADGAIAALRVEQGKFAQ